VNGAHQRLRSAAASGRAPGDDDSPHGERRELIDSHLPLVRAVARRYAGRGEELDDLVQAGSVALVRASDRYDPDRGVTFTTFATPAIEGEIRRHLRERTRSLKLPRDMQQMSSSARRSQGELAVALGRFPTTEELAAEMGAELPEVERALAAARASDPVAVAPGDDAIESPDSAEPLAGSDDRLLIADGLRVLDQRERRIVFLRFHADMTERQIGRALGISQAHVSRLLDGALAKLRAQLGNGAADITSKAVISPDSHRRSPTKRSKSRRRGSKAPVGLGTDSRIGGVGTEQDGQRTRPSKAKAASGYSGRFLVRMPSELHQQLARAAEREDVSLNRFVTEKLATIVAASKSEPLASEPQAADPRAADPRAADPQAADPQAADPPASLPHAAGPQDSDRELVPEPLLEPTEEVAPERGSRYPSAAGLRVALATNLVVVVLAGLVAVILLVLALQRGI
jgi:RNA polymerase sigma-B factor